MATSSTTRGSLNYQAAKAAFKSFTDLSRADHPIPVNERTAESMRRAANLMDRIMGCVWGSEIQRRAEFLTKMTRSGSEFEAMRLLFASAIATTEEPPPDADDPNFLTLQDDRGGFADFPRRLKQATDMMRRWRLELPPDVSNLPDGAFPPLTTDSPDKSAPKKKAKPKIPTTITQSPSSELSLGPRLLAERLHLSLETLAAADREHQSWACDLLLHCHKIAKMGSEDQAAQGWLAGLWSPFTPVLEAMQKVATDIIEEQLLTTHGADFRSVVWFGCHHTFSSTQADCVCALWKCWESGALELGQNEILSAAKSQSERIHDVFKGHTTWRELMGMTPNKGCWTLLVPSSVDATGKPEWPD